MRVYFKRSLKNLLGANFDEYVGTHLDINHADLQSYGFSLNCVFGPVNIFSVQKKA